MIKDQIKAELRRSALRSVSPYDASGFAFSEVLQFKEPHYDGHMDECEDAQWRTFYLLVAEVL